MHWIQDEQSIEYHVVRWDNSAFHNHDKVNKRKLLGGVSFDGGGAGGGKTGSTVQGTGVNSLQSSFPDGNGLGLGNGTGLLNESGKAGSSIEGTGNTGKDTVSIHNVQAGDIPKEAEAIAGLQVSLHTDNADMSEAADIVKPEREKQKNSFDYQKYIKKMRSGIKSFLQSMRQKSGKEQKRQDVKKEIKGTRPVTKEDVYEIQINTAYLLDSYNKYGERSTLGKD